MSKRIRLALLGVSAVAALGFASAALAVYSPSLSITRHLEASGNTSTDITFAQVQADDPTAKVTIFAPPGFSGTLDQAVGTQLGTVAGQVFAQEILSVVPVEGTITVADKSSPQLKAAAKQCTGTENHDAIWILTVAAAGNSLNVPAYVDQITTAPFSALASASLAFCLSPPSQVVFKIRLLNATLHINDVFAPPGTPGAFRWTAINTPYKADDTPNAAGTIETQGIDRTPVEASFNAKRVTKTRKVKHKNRTDIFYSYFARITGSVEAGGQGAAGVGVDILVGDKKVATATTNDNGAFSKTLKLTKTTTFHAQAAQEAAPLAGATCQPPIPVGPGVDLPCGTIMEGGFTVTTDEVTVKKPKLKVKHIKKKKKKKKRRH